MAGLILTLYIVDLWQYYICCRRSDVIRCTPFMVLYRCRMCQWGLHVVLFSHIGILMRLLAAEPYSTAGLLFPSQCLSGMILLPLCTMVCNCRVSRAGSMHFHWPMCLCIFIFYCFHFVYFLVWVDIVRLWSTD